jgi:hypothetical protein
MSYTPGDPIKAHDGFNDKSIPGALMAFILNRLTGC